MLMKIYVKIKNFLGINKLKNRPNSQEELYNIVYSWQLEFGPEWAKPIQQKIDERISFLADNEKQHLGKLLKDAHMDISGKIYEALDAEVKKHPEVDYRKIVSEAREKGCLEPVKEEIKKLYPWLSEANLAHEVSQQQYYMIMH